MSLVNKKQTDVITLDTWTRFLRKDFDILANGGYPGDAHLQRKALVIGVPSGVLGDAPGRKELAGLKQASALSLRMCRFCLIMRSHGNGMLVGKQHFDDAGAEECECVQPRAWDSGTEVTTCALHLELEEGITDIAQGNGPAALADLFLNPGDTRMCWGACTLEPVRGHQVVGLRRNHKPKMLIMLPLTIAMNQENKMVFMLCSVAILPKKLRELPRLAHKAKRQAGALYGNVSLAVAKALTFNIWHESLMKMCLIGPAGDAIGTPSRQVVTLHLPDLFGGLFVNNGYDAYAHVLSPQICNMQTKARLVFAYEPLKEQDPLHISLPEGVKWPVRIMRFIPGTDILLSSVKLAHLAGMGEGFFPALENGGSHASGCWMWLGKLAKTLLPKSCVGLFRFALASCEKEGVWQEETLPSRQAVGALGKRWLSQRLPPIGAAP
ncbi:hypothetical protein BDK51DRAFT_30040 [Blyttiomyces helicus]|uniref:Uncharacterized protein n=1 Tax=Blyttiomyces helicus TaxID=388810 RepID=A0A4P9WIF9_9FUNG|nr:hypothetical protein BDK51DRAFT_30040 [Blyttiomyces helicus]|eukprot:RKO90910.1 hypothetical protein BDK51DRAFT_30040 [Blyttiomyces helicus]